MEQPARHDRGSRRGDDGWKARQIRRITAELDALGYRTTHRQAVVDRLAICGRVLTSVVGLNTKIRDFIGGWNTRAHPSIDPGPWKT